MNLLVKHLPEQLRTPRLILREPRTTDAPILFEAYLQDPEVSRYMVWRPHSAPSEAEAFVALCIEDWEACNRRPYVIVTHQHSQVPIGMLEARVLSHHVDIGYVLARQFWGQGLMPEAVQALTEKALASSHFFRVQATCDVENIPSAHTLEKSGFKREGTLERYTIHPNVGAEPRACHLYARCR